MNKLLILLLTVFLFSCAPKTTQEQNDAYNSCKKTILDNKSIFLAGSTSKENEDSLKQYLDDLEKCNLDQFVSKYDVAPEDVNVFVYSVCSRAEGVKSMKVIQDELIRTDSLYKTLK